jgi:hypothetical protein
MTKQTQTYLILGAIAAAAYYFLKMAPASGNAETATEAAQSAASTLQANLNATLGL